MSKGSWLTRFLTAKQWVGVGVLATVALALIGFYLTKEKPRFQNRLTFSTETSKKVIDFPESVGGRTQILIDGKEERDLRLFVFVIQYRGEVPLVTDHFAEPIRATLPGTRKILVVQSASNIDRPRILDKESRQLVDSPTPANRFAVRRIDEQHFEIEPLLMNPDEWFAVEVYTAAKNSSSAAAQTLTSLEQYKELQSEVTWECHLVGASCPGPPMLDALEAFGFNSPAVFQIFIYHRGMAVYALILLSALNFFVLGFFSVATGIAKLSNYKKLGLASIAVVLSICTAEFFTAYVLDEPPFNERPIWLLVIAIIDLAVIVELASSFFGSRWKARRSVRD